MPVKFDAREREKKGQLKGKTKMHFQVPSKFSGIFSCSSFG